MRRKFYEVHQATGSPIAAEALRRIAELYAIECCGLRDLGRRVQSLLLRETATEIRIELPADILVDFDKALIRATANPPSTRRRRSCGPSR